jgi:hypothetical protein
MEINHRCESTASEKEVEVLPGVYERRRFLRALPYVLLQQYRRSKAGRPKCLCADAR